MNEIWEGDFCQDETHYRARARTHTENSRHPFPRHDFDNGWRGMNDLYPGLIDRPLVAKTYRPLGRGSKRVIGPLDFHQERS